MYGTIEDNSDNGYLLQSGNNVQLRHNIGHTITFRDLIILIENAQRDAKTQTSKEAKGVLFSELNVEYRENISGSGPLDEKYSIIMINGRISHLDGKELKYPISVAIHGSKERDKSGYVVNYIVSGDHRATHSVDGVAERSIDSRYVSVALRLAREKLGEKADQIRNNFAELIEFEKAQIADGVLKAPANPQEIRLAEHHLREHLMKAAELGTIYR